ncbi:long-chain-fatty-acid--CoA ligase isoform X4 [Dermacentor silvarum]|uniref:long-chain-fatty-acid--CoA ligase isoform X4 n=1 Tax=Dermacentor silvarum TaxID=543639 RepID=UPI00189B8435|nr:long-chain-fatty-acid--CoA ligase isoform X4 [Dermacentor silvarum]
MKARIEDGVVYSPFPDVEIPCCSFYEAVKRALLVDADKPILADDSVTLTKKELLSQVRRYAAGFQRHGIRPGARVCVHVSNNIDSIVAMWGCVVAGASIVLAKPSLTEKELLYQITDSDSTHLLVDPDLSEKARSAVSALELKGCLATGAAKGFVSTLTFLDIDETEFQETTVEDPRECVLCILYTSGTTGLPKGVELTHYALLASLGMSRWTFPHDDSDVVLLPTPITHGSGLMCITFSVLLGTKTVVMPPNASLENVIRSASKQKIVDQMTERRLGPYQTGEIRYRAPNVMKSYYKRPKETEEFFDVEGWCKSGDAGYYDEEGRIHFVQRFKEMIKCMDNQVVPAALEETLLAEHYRVLQDVCVVGIPSPKYGEAPAAAVVPRNTDDKALVDLANRIKSTIVEHFAVHQHLYGGVFFLDSLPKTESGKTNRAAVLEQCASLSAY